jgi:hypothetical protein
MRTAGMGPQRACRGPGTPGQSERPVVGCEVAPANCSREEAGPGIESRASVYAWTGISLCFSEAHVLAGLVRRVLCHELCHNPVIPTRVEPLLAVSLRYTRKAVNVRETRMNTAFLCRSISVCVCPSRFALGNGMEEVVGSIPTRSTNHSQVHWPCRTGGRKATALPPGQLLTFDKVETQIYQFRRRYGP